MDIRSFIKRVWTQFEFWLRTRKMFLACQPRSVLFFPGCALTATDPELTLRTLSSLQTLDPNIGLWSDCCGQPLQQFSSEDARAEKRLLNIIQKLNVKEVILACGNCASHFKNIAKVFPDLQVSSVYQKLNGVINPISQGANYGVYHPCGGRKNAWFAQSFLQLVEKAGVQLQPPRGQSYGLPCCLSAHEHSKSKQVPSHLLTYCAHCTGMLSKKGYNTQHVLQLIFGQASRWSPPKLLQKFKNYFQIKTQIS